MTDSAEPAPAGSRAALSVLLALVVLSPWPFGSVHLRTTQAIALISLTTALVAFLWDGWHGRLCLPPRPLLWALLGLWGLAVFQLTPIPSALHHLLAPGSAFIWYPSEPAVAAVLGPGPHPISIWPDATKRWLAFTTGVVTLALAAAPALRHRRELVRASTVVVGGAVLLALYAFVARLAFGSRLYGVWTVPTVAPFGPFVSKNHFAGYVELAALLAIGLATGLRDEARHGSGALSWIESRRAQRVVIAWAAAAILVLAVAVSLSRGGVVSLAAGLAAFFALRTWSRKASPLPARGLALTAAGALVGAAAVIAVLPHDSRARILTLTGITTEESGSYRLAIWKDTLRLAASSPAVGSGFGAYEDALPRFKTAAGNLRVEHAENDHFELLAEGGLLGTLLGATAVLTLLFLATKGLEKEKSRLLKALRMGAIAGLVALYIHSVFDFNLHIPSSVLIAALIAATLVPRSSQAENQTLPPRTLAFGFTLPTALTLLMALLTPWTQPPWDPTLLFRVQSAPMTDLRTTTLKNALASHLQRRPAHAIPWLHLAWLTLQNPKEDPAPFATWATTLDPQNESVSQAAARITAVR